MVFDCDFSRRTSRPWLGRAPHETRSSMIATVKYMFSLVDIESEGLTRIIGDEGERGGESFVPSLLPSFDSAAKCSSYLVFQS